MTLLSHRVGLHRAGHCLALLALCGCSSTAQDGTPIATDGTLTGHLRELSAPGSTYKLRQRVDDEKCREFGFKPGTEGYGNCRLQIEQIRATQQAALGARASVRSNTIPTAHDGERGLSFMCKDALSRGDQGAVFVHC